MGGRYHRLHARSGEGHWCRRVSLQDDTVIPGRSEMNVATRVICRPWKEVTSDCQWGTEPTTMLPGVHVSRTLIPSDRLDDVLVRVVNVLSEPVTFLAGTVVAELQPVEVIDAMFEESATSVIEAREEETHTKLPNEDDDGVPEFVRTLVDGVHPSLPESTVLALESLLLRYQDIFSKSEVDLGLTNIVSHHIDTGAAKPFRQQLRRYPPAHVEAISQHVDNMITQGV